MRATSMLAAAAAAVLLGAAPAAHAEDHRGKVPWVENVEEGLKKAKQTGLPVMLFFTADW